MRTFRMIAVAAVAATALSACSTDRVIDNTTAGLGAVAKTGVGAARLAGRGAKAVVSPGDD